VLQVQQETTPGWRAERVTWDGHVSVGSLVDVIGDFLKAPEEASDTSQDELNYWVLSRLLLDLFSEVDKDDSNESD
jgi:hypothetical protein